MVLEYPYVFQCDSEVVLNVYENDPNYLIEYTNSTHEENICCIYFSSNDIYYPNNENVFVNKIINKNHYEWYNTRIKSANKHIFVRDIFKQWYIKGINKSISTPEKLLSFLKNETNGYKVITIGSSAGGYAAVLYGSLLNASYVLTFNGQFELNSLLHTSVESINPLIFREAANSPNPYFDLSKIITNISNIYYFYSKHSIWDKKQFNHIKSLKQINIISFLTSHHGIPFLKINLNNVINLPESDLYKLTQDSHHPLFFSLKLVGIKQTFEGIYHQIKKKYFNK